MKDNSAKVIIRADRQDLSEYRRLLRSSRQGTLIRLRNGLYAHPEALTGNLIDIGAIIRDGILCLFSAWAYYGLTTQIPGAYYVAVERSRKIVLPSFPQITLVFQRRDLLDIGKIRIEQEGFSVNITDLERSVCDAVKYRNKIGMDAMNEIIDSYLRHPDHSLSRLAEYAKKLRVYNTLTQILMLKL